LFLRVGSEDERRPSELLCQDSGQGKGAVQSLAAQLAKSIQRLLAVADKYQGFLSSLGSRKAS